MSPESSPEPVNLFSHRIDVRGVITCLRNAGCEVEVDGPDDDWRHLVVLGPKRLLKRRARLVVGHDPEYYDYEDWPTQLLGMQNYFSSFPDVPSKTDIFRVIQSFRFSLAFPECDLDIDSDDERVSWVQAICRHLDGVIFTPSGLRDSSGRILISAYEDADPAAVLPAIPATHDLAESEDDFDGDEPTAPPSPERVARRAIVLAAVANRGLIENEPEELEDPDGTREVMIDWIRELHIENELEPQEWKALQRPVGMLERQETIDAIWRLEGLGVLLWALNAYELPRYDELVIPGDLFDAVQFADTEASRQFLSHPRLRPANELEAYCEHALMVHWRLRDYSLRPQAMNFVEFSKDCWRGSFDLGPFRILDDDLALGDVPIAEASEEQLQICGSIANERHRAINWLLGGSRIYSETDTST